MKQIHLWGIKIDAVSCAEAVELALSDCREQPCWVVTPNAVMLDACRRDVSLKALLARADLSLPDGAGVLLAARRAGTPLACRVAGIDFGEALLARAEREGLRVFLLGGGEGVAQRAAASLLEIYPRLRICGTYWGYFDQTGEEDRRLCEHLRLLRPDILLVCLGFPLQERWIDTHRSYLAGVRVIAGLGGSLDVWAGDTQRAPRPLRALGMEWAWRMAHEPRRLRQIPAIMRTVLRAEGRGNAEKTR